MQEDHPTGVRARAVTARSSTCCSSTAAKPLPDNTIAVDGDTALLDFWLGHIAFG